MKFTMIYCLCFAASLAWSQGHSDVESSLVRITDINGELSSAQSNTQKQEILAEGLKLYYFLIDCAEAKATCGNLAGQPVEQARERIKNFKNIFITGESLFVEKIKQQKQVSEIIKSIDELKANYQRRVDFRGQEEKDYVWNRYAYYLYVLFINNIKIDELFSKLVHEFDEILNKQVHFSHKTAMYYFDIFYVRHTQKKDVKKETFVDAYEIAMEQMEAYQESNPQDINQIEEFKAQIEARISALKIDIKMSCEEIKNKIHAKFIETQDVNLGLKVLRKSQKNDCTKEKFYEETLIKIHKANPNYSSAKALGLMYFVNKDFSSAQSYLEQSIKLTKEQNEISKSSLYLARLLKSNDKAKATHYAQEAAKVEEYSNEAYSLLGSLYFYAIHDKGCQGKNAKDQMIDKALMAKAHEMYQLAGNKENADKAWSSIGTIEHYHTVGMPYVGQELKGKKQKEALEDGTKYIIDYNRPDCWVGELNYYFHFKNGSLYKLIKR